MIRLEVFENNLERLGSIEKYASVSYIKQCRDAGSFTLTCMLNQKNLELLQSQRLLWIEDDVCGIIQYVDKQRNDGDTTFTIKGKLLNEILNWRWVFPCFVKTGQPASLMEQLVDTHCVNPSDAKRKFSNLVIQLSSIPNVGSITYQKTGGSVLESEINLATANDLCFQVCFNPREQNPMKFQVYKGVDRTVGNADGNDEVYFTQSLNNLLNSTYMYNDDAFRNVELVAGETEDGSDNENAKRTTLEVFLNEQSKQLSGFQRKEKFVDARDLQSEYSEEQVTTDEDGNQVTETVEKKMSVEEYAGTLAQRGNEKFDESTIEESYSGSIRTDSRTIFQYKKDYDVGDKVTIIDEQFGVRMDVPITEMKVTFDKEAYTYEPTFGVAIPTINQKVKRLEKRR